MACRAHGTGILAEDSRKCHCAGFFLTNQNRFLMTDKETGDWTPRGKTVIAHTPMGRLGDPKDLLGGVLWLLSPASDFVTAW